MSSRIKSLWGPIGVGRTQGIARQHLARRVRRRCLSTEGDAPTPPAKAYVSRSLDPYFNLSFEEWLFRKTDARQTLLFMYRNRSSVIIGRNQNPWKEIDTHALRRLDIPFVRRRSGGGTVYHDEGNVNFSVLVPRTGFDRRTNAELIARVVSSLGVPAYVNERHDICVEGFKVSGSAFKLVNARAYHHGTMLIDSRLEDLRGVLKPRRDGMVTRGVASVSSPVANLRKWSDTITPESFIEGAVDEFNRTYGGDDLAEEVDEDVLRTNDFVREGADELRSWDWQYGQTPEFTYSIPIDFLWGSAEIEIKSKHAKVLEASPRNLSADSIGTLAIGAVASALTDEKYDAVDQRKIMDSLRSTLGTEGRERAEEVLQAVCEGM